MTYEKRISSILAGEELQKTSDIHEMSQRMEAQKSMEIVRKKAIEVLSLFAANQDFVQLFLVQSIEDLSAFVFAHKSDRVIVIDILARCPKEQLVNCDSYKFASHPEFEKKVTHYTRTAEKPNNQLAKCRPWDVALQLVVKIEALDTQVMQQPNMRLLFREFNIIKHMWDFYMRENMELDEMTGIPLVFKYEEVPNPCFNYDSSEYKVVDIYGNLIPWKSENGSTLSYMCMEQLGPNLHYLMDLMIAGKKRGLLFDIDTAFKIFDQLLCRCLQMHRFGVMHNAIEPRNLYFGRRSAFNVLYVASFSQATLFDMKDTSNARKATAGTDLYGSHRFASHMRMRGSQPHPVHDLESAFYTLIVSLTNNLPWDTCFSNSGAKPAPMRSSTLDISANNQSNQIDMVQIERKTIIQNMREMKAQFWRMPNGIARVLADLQFMASGDDRHRVSLACEIIKELYARIRDILTTIGSDAPAVNFFPNLLLQHTSEYQIYTDVRRSVLMLFRFESVSAIINTPTYQKKIESLAHNDVESTVRLAWNLTNWCFNSIEVNVAPSNVAANIRSTVRIARTAD